MAYFHWNKYYDLKDVLFLINVVCSDRYFDYFSEMLMDSLKQQAYWVFINCLIVHSHETTKKFWMLMP